MPTSPTRPTRTLPYGQQRLLEIALALATRPKVLLLDEPAAGVPKNESAMLFAVIAALPADISVLFIEHDMDIVFSFATRIIVLVAGGVLIEADPAAVRSDPARARGLSRPGRPWLSRCWSSATCAPAMARPSCSTASRSPCPQNGSLAVLGRNGVGKTTLLLTAMGFVPPGARLGPSAPAATSRGCRRTGARAWASAGCRRSARSSPRSASRRTCTVAARPGRWDLGAV